MKLKELWRQQAAELAAAAPETEQEAKAAEAAEICRLLLAFVLHIPVQQVRLRQEQELTPTEAEKFTALCQQIKAGNPVQYVIGEQEFMSLPFAVGEGVLIPRWETELLVEKALTLLPKERPVRLADICTGSGAIGVSLCHCLPLAYCFAVDISPEALQYARENSRKNKVDARMTFLQGDLLGPIGELWQWEGVCQLDMILSNPPYVTAEEMAALPQHVRCEPSLALYGGADGLDFYRRLAAESLDFLVEGGWLCVECGYTQGMAVKELWERHGLQAVEVCQDYSGKDRIVIGQKKTVNHSK